MYAGLRASFCRGMGEAPGGEVKNGSVLPRKERSEGKSNHAPVARLLRQCCASEVGVLSMSMRLVALLRFYSPQREIRKGGGGASERRTVSVGSLTVALEDRAGDTAAVRFRGR